IALKEGDLETAKELFTASLAGGPEVNYNLGIVKIMEGDYGAAVNYFGNTPSYNAALAQYLNKNTDAAWRTIVNLPEENPMRYYLMAIIAAAQDKPAVVMENLKNAFAVCEDPAKLKDRVLNDLEFAKLWNVPGFKEILP
ncbi:MAG: hypothetical protein JXR52_00005, partial [Bacteroidales bacterium]|nr:hypothetical protein [Bacteroidales bacterium]